MDEHKKWDESKSDEPLTSNNLRLLIKSSVAKLGPNYTKEQKIEHAKLLVKIFERGMPPKDAMNISDQEITQVYSFAYQLFIAGQFEKALELFKMLVLLEPVVSGFAVALGVCYHRLKDFDNAIRCYMLGSALDENDPVPLFYAYDCYINLQNILSAGVMLCNVISRAGDQKKYAKIKEQAQLLLDSLEKKILNRQKITTQPS